MSRSRLFSADPGRVPQYLFALSAGLTLVLLVEITNQIVGFTAHSGVSEATLPWPYIMSFLLSVPFIAGIGYVGVYLDREPFPRDRNPRILEWCLAGVVLWLAINLLTMASFGIFALWPTIGWVRGAIAWGGAFGLLVGIVEAQAITNAVSAEQARLRTEHLRERRDTIDYYNSLLRHEVLNSITVVQARSQLLADEIPETDDHHDHVEAILRHSEDITSVVQDTRAMMEAVHHEPEWERISLRELVTSEVEMVRDVDPDVDVTVEVPEDVYVPGDDMLGRVFGNLLSNAVEHNDSDTARISVTVTAGDDEVTVRISDNGPGIDPETRAELFERPEARPADHGFGLYIVAQLCDRYGGAVELVDTGDDGTTFRVTLPRVAAEASPDHPEATV